MVTSPKTPKSNRKVTITPFLAEDLKEYCSMLYGITPKERMFQFTKSFMEHEIVRGIKETGVKRIRLHDLRHSHASLLISMGSTAVEIAERVGQESVEITYRYAHMFPDERKALEERIYLSGLKKQDYMIRSALFQKIVVVGNQKMFGRFVGELKQIRKELQKINNNSEMKVDMLVSLRTICEIVEGLGYSPSISNFSNE